jgi:hypothetical protein
MNELGLERNHLQFLFKQSILYYQTYSLFGMINTLNKHIFTPSLILIYTK